MLWQLRYLRNTAFSLLPGQEKLRQLKRRFAPYSAEFDQWAFEQGLKIVEMLRTTETALGGGLVVELGSGWKPTIPLLLRVAGARKVLMVDAQRLLDARLLRETTRMLVERADFVGNRLGMASSLVSERLKAADSESLDEIAESLGLEYLAPCDARHLRLDDGTADAVVSRAVLEHIPPAIIEQLFGEFARVLRPGTGRMCHVIDNSDHWAHLDRRLSKLNFLRYSDAVWKWFARNPLDYMNRLRHSDYLDLLTKSGFEVVMDASEPDEEALRDLTMLPLANRFQGRSTEDLAVLTTYVVAAPSVGHEPRLSR